MNLAFTIMKIVCVFLLISYCANAQEKYDLGFLPSITIEKQFSSSWNLNTKIESRQVFTGYVGFNYDYLLTDFTSIVDKKIGFNHNLGGGYVLRVNGNILMHRFIQQFSLDKEYKKI